MSMISMFLKELDEEAQITREMISRIPNDKFDWQPHPKSMTIRRLASHIAELPGWVAMAITTDELDFQANPYTVPVFNTTAEILAFFEECQAKGKAQLVEANEPRLSENWTLRNGDHIILVRTKAEVIRMSINQIVHHRAQLGVFLRLLNVPIPGSYGPSADDMGL
ncbi:DinB family protein [Mucilaginibacter sp. AW1-3]